MFDLYDDGSSSFPPEADHVFATLPRPVLNRILSFVHFGQYTDPDLGGTVYLSNALYDAGLRGLVSLASSDKFLQHLVYKKCTFLWEDLDFSYILKLTDARLHTFLNRVNAAQVSRCVRVRGCTITGAGLAPLAGSRVLEAVDLVDMNPSPPVPATAVDLAEAAIDHETVWSTLDSMLPWKLATVRYNRFNETPLDELKPSSMKKFLLRFADTTGDRLVKQNKACSFCDDCHFRDVVINNDRVASNVFASSQCFVCKKFTCKPWTDNSECPNLQTCYDCRNSYCDDCSLQSCDVCNNTYYCKSCRSHQHCHLCDKIICEWCGPVDHCMFCQQFSCRECSSSSYFFRCDVCNQYACPDCRKSGCLTCIKTQQRDLCRFDSQCYRCGCLLNETELQADPCSYCFEKYCSQASCYPHACISPKDQVFRSRNTGGGKDHEKTCPCGHSTLQRAKGQQFLCTYVTRK